MSSVLVALLVVVAIASSACGGGSEPPQQRTTFFVAGTVSGLAGTLRVRNGGDELTVSANGRFAFPTPLRSGETFDVTLLDWPPMQACTVTRGSGTISAADVNVAVTCAALNIVFVSSATYSGDLGGLAGADLKCNTLSAAAGLAGTYKAFLHTATASAQSRLGSARGWVRPDGKPFADTVADLADDGGKVLHPPRLDEHGADVGQVWVYTGDAAANRTCTGWTSTSGADLAGLGRTSGTTSVWSDSGVGGCSTPYRIYCLGVDGTAPLPARPVAGRIAFLALAGFSRTGGLAGADAYCQAQADAAGLTGTFEALLASTTASPVSRFSTTGPTWVRPDGVPVVTTAGDLATDVLVSPINQTASGTYIAGGYLVWVGANSLGAAGTPASTCNGWSSSSSSYSAAVGSAAYTTIGWGTWDCSFQGAGVFCLEK
jgi:hypothetical protein